MNAKKYTLWAAVGLAIVLTLIIVKYSPEGESSMTQGKAGYTNINSEELGAMMKSKDFKLINVHIPYGGEIPGTDLFIPYNKIGEEINLPKDEKIVLYCRSGAMSRVAAEKLAELGYTNVYNLEGGMNGWKKQGFELLDKKKDEMDEMSPDVPAQPLQDYDPAKAAYFAMGPANTIKVVDIASGKIADVLPAGNNPHGIAVSKNGEYVFTTSTRMGPKEMIMEPDHQQEPMDMKKMMKMGSDEISVTSTRKRSVIKRINVGGGTHHMAITPDSRYVLATVPSKSGISIIDAAALEETGFVETGKVPNYVAVSPDGNIAYVTNKGEDTLAVVDLKAEKVVKKTSTGLRPDHVAVSPDGRRVYVAEGGADSVSVVDAETGEVIKTIPVGESPHGIAVRPQGDKVYVSNSEGKSVSVISTATLELITTVNVGAEVSHIEVTPDGGKVYANSEEQGKVYVISTATNSVESEIDIGPEPHQVSFPAGKP